MAKRGSAGKKKSPARGGGRAKGRDAGFEVEDQGSATGFVASLEDGLVFVTFVALLVGIILAQVDLSSSFDAGWLF